MFREELAEQGDHSDSLACARCDGAGQKAGIKYLSRIEERVGPTLLVARKCGHEFTIAERNRVDRHSLHPR